jgi:putative FmdB family regulatory protein
MPLYEYECESCHHRFEKIQKFSDAPIDTCPSCGAGPVRKLLSSPAIQFKGSGWYITDYAKKSGSDAGKAASGKSDAADKGAAKAESGSADSGGSSSEKPSSSTAKSE